MKAITVGKSNEVTICRGEDDNLHYLVDYSTLVRWESALRRILEYMAKTPAIASNPEKVRICLVVVDQTSKLTLGDKMQLNKALSFINAKAVIV